MSDRITYAKAMQLDRNRRFACEYESPGDLLHTRLEQAYALSSLICGDGGVAFMNYADDIQDGVHSALHSLIADAKVAAERAADAESARRRAA